MNHSAKHIIFCGNVQGVGFRFTTYNIAKNNQLTGFVRNLPDGSVEMVVQGSEIDISDSLEQINESFAGYIRETKVENVISRPQYTDFKITF